MLQGKVSLITPSDCSAYTTPDSLSVFVSFDRCSITKIHNFMLVKKMFFSSDKMHSKSSVLIRMVCDIFGTLQLKRGSKEYILVIEGSVPPLRCP